MSPGRFLWGPIPARIRAAFHVQSPGMWNRALCLLRVSPYAPAAPIVPGTFSIALWAVPLPSATTRQDHQPCARCAPTIWYSCPMRIRPDCSSFFPPGAERFDGSQREAWARAGPSQGGGLKCALPHMGTPDSAHLGVPKWYTGLFPGSYPPPRGLQAIAGPGPARRVVERELHAGGCQPSAGWRNCLCQAPGGGDLAGAGG